MNLAVLSDFDGTIAEVDTGEFVLARFAQGDWLTFDRQYERGQISLEECMRNQFSLLTASKEEILSELDKVVTFRPNFEKLARYCKRISVPFVIVSAGLDFIINHFLELNDWEGFVETYTAKTQLRPSGLGFTFPKLLDPTSVDFKQDLVRRYRTQGKKVIYIGDGSADYAAAKDADYLFAIKGSKLARFCEKQRISCSVITEFTEVVETICRVTVSCARFSG